MFKVSKPEMVNKTFRMPAELVERLNVVAQAQKVSLNNLVCQCCEYALDNLSEQKEDKERPCHGKSDIAAILFYGIKVFKAENRTLSPKKSFNRANAYLSKNNGLSMYPFPRGRPPVGAEYVRSFRYPYSIRSSIEGMVSSTRGNSPRHRR